MNELKTMPAEEQADVAKKIAQLLAESGAKFFEVDQIFFTVKSILTVGVSK